MTHDPTQLPEGWEQPVNAAALESELKAELDQSHPLFGRPAMAIAQSSESDEAVFAFSGDKEFLAVVALTWEETPLSGHPEFEEIPNLRALDGFFD